LEFGISITMYLTLKENEKEKRNLLTREWNNLYVEEKIGTWVWVGLLALLMIVEVVIVKLPRVNGINVASQQLTGQQLVAQQTEPTYKTTA